MVWRVPPNPRFHLLYVTDVIELLRELFRPASGDETILPRDETVSRFGADMRKQPLVISLTAKRRTALASRTETVTCEPSALSSA